MPLKKSASKAAVSSNIKAEIASGKPQRQAVAIALDVARRARKANGGGVFTGYNLVVLLGEALRQEVALPAQLVGLGLGEHLPVSVRTLPALLLVRSGVAPLVRKEYNTAH
jgi:hypothetical protein